MTVTKSVSQEICQKKWRRNLLADLVTVTTSASKKIYCRNWEAVNLLEDLVTVTKSASQGIMQTKMLEEFAGRHSACLIFYQSGNLLAEIGEGDKSPARFSDCHKIFQSGKCAGRNGEGICWQI